MQYWSIRNQIFLPIAILQIVSVTTISLWSAYRVSLRDTQERQQRLTSMFDSLERGGIPYTESVLRTMQGLSSCHFLILDDSGNLLGTSFDSESKVENNLDQIRQVPATRELQENRKLSVAEIEYFVSAIDTRQADKAVRLLVFVPAESWQAATWRAATPTLAIGGTTLLILLALSGWLASYHGRRIRGVTHLFKELETGNFTTVPVQGFQDEIRDLVSSANELSTRLSEYQAATIHTERMRLLAQMAGGIAHHIRNDVTGAKLAIQVHQRRCSKSDDEGLQIALRQLALTEDHIQGLLALGRQPQRIPRTADLKHIVDQVTDVVGASMAHRGVHFEHHVDLVEGISIHDADALRAALVNLLSNGMDAAGASGEVRFDVSYDATNAILVVEDTGPGLDSTISDRMGEPFLSNKKDGIGLGLMLVRQTATSLGGALSYNRRGERTQFTLTIPRAAKKAE